MDQSNDPIIPEAGHLNGTSEVGTTESTGVTEADPPATEQATEGVGAGLRPGFLAELAVAMRATAEKERERIAARVSEDASAHVDKVRARAAIETDELKRLADEDVQHIEEWSAAEMERIRAEADRRIEDRRASLEEYLQQHDTIIETEIEGVNDAVRAYGETLDRYFEELAQAGDPSAIVARAEALPAPPDLDQVRAQARARAVQVFAERENEAFAAEEAAPMTPPEPAMAAPEPEMPAPVPEMMAPEPAPEMAIDAVDMTETPTTAEAMSPEPVAQDTPEPEIRAEAEPALAEPAMSEVAASDGSMPVEAAPEPEVAPAPTATADPVPVMDSTPSGQPSWPSPASRSEELETVAASVDHTSAAVRLLRSVAPWTAPTHAGSNDRTDNE